MINLLENSNLSISHSKLNHFGHLWSHFDMLTREFTGRGLGGYWFGFEPRYPGVTPAFPYEL